MAALGQMRSDAVRNRGRILETALEQITTRGPEVSMDEIARAAGVAVGTLYRHFPTKADLVAATLEQHISVVADQLESAAQNVAQGESATDLILDLFAGSADSQAEGRLLKEIARSLGVYDTSGEAMQRMDSAVRTMLEQGVANGTVRPTIEPSDIYLLMSTLPTEQPEPVRRRWAELVLRGIGA